ncbi:MAG: sigma-54-dependent Fis family transcriptional regulator [Planctomycetes bacterium]|nr:sigma-54-dependent Fis family transcriptional regulator [Planctomycetota bacterium]
MADSSSSQTAIDRLNKQTLSALLQASRAINDAIKPSEVCELVATHAAKVLKAQGASVLLLDTNRSELVFQTMVDPTSSDIARGHRFPADKGVAGQVIKTRRSVRIENARDNSNFYAGVDLMTKTKTQSLMAAPLIHCDEVLGVLEVVNRKDGTDFSDEDLKLLEIFANLVAGAAKNAESFDRLGKENRGLRESLPTANFIGKSQAFCQALEMCEKVAPQLITVLLTGETGTGKEMAARAIHDLSPRHDQPFIAVNCAALPESLIESELFGHEQGAFTGATKQRLGKFEIADGGTLLLDEIGELEINMQAKLLRVLEEKEFMRVGGTEPVYCDVRVIAASNRDLKAETDAGRFREDLFYRLNVFPIKLPALRERIDDLSLLIEHIMAQVVPSLGIEAPTISDEAFAKMRGYNWPGNVRELRNVIERALLLSDGEVRNEHLHPEIVQANSIDQTEVNTSALADQERKLVLEALQQNNWNQSAASRQLGITRDILRYRVKRYGLTRPI